MNFWPSCSMDIIYEDKRLLASLPCQVSISNGTIAVSYEDENGPVVYEGAEIEPGHFKLTAPKVSGRATLHRFPNGTLLEGHWFEDGIRGMWRITLDH
ncbi:hypothetical protein ACRC7T_16335 [Segnochrobactraceae bacterium EtOH-i3]